MNLSGAVLHRWCVAWWKRGFSGTDGFYHPLPAVLVLRHSVFPTPALSYSVYLVSAGELIAGIGTIRLTA